MLTLPPELPPALEAALKPYFIFDMVRFTVPLLCLNLSSRCDMGKHINMGSTATHYSNKLKFWCGGNAVDDYAKLNYLIPYTW